MQAPFQHTAVPVANLSKPVLETRLEAGQRIAAARLQLHGFAARARSSRYFAIVGTSVRDRKYGREHREHDRLGQRNKQIARHAGEKEHRHKHDADATSVETNAGTAICGAPSRMACSSSLPSQIAVDVLNRHRRVIHQDADRQRQSAQRHDVDRLAQRAQAR